MFRKNCLFLARLPGISANSNENYGHYNFQIFAYFSGKFPEISEILNFRKIYDPRHDYNKWMYRKKQYNSNNNNEQIQTMNS